MCSGWVRFVNSLDLDWTSKIKITNQIEELLNNQTHILETIRNLNERLETIEEKVNDDMGSFEQGSIRRGSSKKVSVGKSSKQAGAELGQAQYKIG